MLLGFSAKTALLSLAKQMYRPKRQKKKKPRENTREELLSMEAAEALSGFPTSMEQSAVEAEARRLPLGCQAMLVTG